MCSACVVCRAVHGWSSQHCLLKVYLTEPSHQWSFNLWMQRGSVKFSEFTVYTCSCSCIVCVWSVWCTDNSAAVVCLVQCLSVVNVYLFHLLSVDFATSVSAAAAAVSCHTQVTQHIDLWTCVQLFLICSIFVDCYQVISYFIVVHCYRLCFHVHFDVINNLKFCEYIYLVKCDIIC